jgi:hypothetical protein
MYAILTQVKLKDPEAAKGFLQSRVVPMSKEAPGFVTAYWWLSAPDMGGSLHVFESEENANAFMEGGVPAEAPVELVSRETYPVEASA